MAIARIKHKPPHAISLLDHGCEFNGRLVFEGTIRIDGKFRGEIFSQDRLIIGKLMQTIQMDIIILLLCIILI